ncbi:hypothetical protein [Streptomyces anthocyanicus]|uniref:hypothetical protein n=1 Tax=Streptomyces anthocyanicus TaxID=68174 RepID=UPI0037FEF086
MPTTVRRPLRPPAPPAPGIRRPSPGRRWAAFLSAARRTRPLNDDAAATELDVRESTVPDTGDGIGHFFTHP